MVAGEPEAIRLNGYLDSARTASDLLLRSLNQARNLVASFKQVAVDQTSDQRRTFDLAEVVGEILTTLSPTMRKTPYAITVDIPKGIVMDSFQGRSARSSPISSTTPSARLRRTPHRQHHPARQPTAKGEVRPLGQR